MDLWLLVLLLVACPVAHLLAMRLASQAPAGTHAGAQPADTPVAGRPQSGRPSLAASVACLNWRVLAAVGVLAAAVWLVAPKFALPTLALLVALICPVLMLLGLRAAPTAGSCHTPSPSARARGRAGEVKGEEEHKLPTTR